MEIIALIEEMAINNRTWRVKRIQGELLKLGITVSRGAVRKYMRRVRNGVPPPKANAVCDDRRERQRLRFIGSVRRECLDHMVILSDRHVQRLIGEYVAFFNHSRPHQGIGQRIPDPPEDARCKPQMGTSRVVGYPVLGGLHHDYRRVA